MQLIYNFDGEDYKYDADISEFVDSLSNTELVKIASYIFDYGLLQDKYVKQLKEEFYELNLPEDLMEDEMDSTVIECAKQIFEYVDDSALLNAFGDEIKDFFEDEAKEQYKTDTAYSADPYNYSGVKPSDF